MAACWKRLSDDPEIELRVIAWSTGKESGAPAFDDSITNGIDCELLSEAQRSNTDRILNSIQRFRPEVLVIPGWLSESYVRCVERLGPTPPKVVMAMDTPWKGELKQYATRIRHNSLFRRVNHVVVASERTWQYARQLGFAEDKISRGVYAWDESCRGRIKVSGTEFPDNFLFVGRFVKEKGLATLLDAYGTYRNSVENPWSLTFCGTGPLSGLVSGPGVKNRGFVQPHDLHAEFIKSSVMVLPSHYEPWGVALAEAMGAGLPVVATEACGSAIDLVRPFWNGLLVPTGSANGLSEALIWFHQNSSRIPEMPQNAQSAAEPYSTRNWAIRWKAMFGQLTRQRAA